MNTHVPTFMCQYVPTFMHKYVLAYGHTDDFKRITEAWREEDENAIVDLALSREHPIVPVKEVALSIIDQDLEGAEPTYVDEIDYTDNVCPIIIFKKRLRDKRNRISSKTPTVLNS